MNSVQLTKAKEHYNQIIALLNEIGKQVQEIDSKYSIETSIKQFDLVLQTIMLNQVIADGDFDNNELDFIQDIVTAADLVEYYNVIADKSYTFETLSWGGLQKFNNKSLNIVLRDINKIMEPIEDELTYLLAIIDSKTEKNEFEMFLKNIALILSCVNFIDEKVTEEEKTATVSNLMKHFVKRYQYYLNAFEKGKVK